MEWDCRSVGVAFNAAVLTLHKGDSPMALVIANATGVACAYVAHARPWLMLASLSHGYILGEARIQSMLACAYARPYIR